MVMIERNQVPHLHGAGLWQSFLKCGSDIHRSSLLYHSFLSLIVMVCSFPFWVYGQGTGQSPESAAEMVNPMAALIPSIAVVVLMAVLSIVIFLVIQRKSNSQGSESSLSEMEFENSMRSQFRSGSSVTTAVSGTGAEPAAPVDSAEVASGGSVEPAPVSSSEAPAAVGSVGSGTVPDLMQRVIDQFWAAELLEGTEGTVALDPNLPPAQLLVLCGGKRAMLFPPQTPLSLIMPYRKTVDKIILLDDNGSALVSQSFSSYIADSLFPQ